MSGHAVLLVAVFGLGIAIGGMIESTFGAAPAPSPTPVATPWLWPVPSGDGQWCVIYLDELGPCFSKVEAAP